MGKDFFNKAQKVSIAFTELNDGCTQPVLLDQKGRSWPWESRWRKFTAALRIPQAKRVIWAHRENDNTEAVTHMQLGQDFTETKLPKGSLAVVVYKVIDPRWKNWSKAEKTLKGLVQKAIDPEVDLAKCLHENRKKLKSLKVRGYSVRCPSEHETNNLRAPLPDLLLSTPSFHAVPSLPLNYCPEGKDDSWQLIAGKKLSTYKKQWLTQQQGVGRLLYTSDNETVIDDKLEIVEELIEDIKSGKDPQLIRKYL